MTKEEVADFGSRYMPAYQHYLPGRYADGPDDGEIDATNASRADVGGAPK